MRTRTYSVLFGLLVVTAACSAPAGGDADTSASAETATTSAFLTFAADGTATASAPLRTTDVLAVVYDTHRLSACGLVVQGAANTPTLTLSWRLAGGAVHDITLGSDWWGTAPSTQARAVFGPFGSTDVGNLEVWFHATGAEECVQWDSSFGKNFTFFVHDARVGTVTFDAAAGHAPTSDTLYAGGFVNVTYPGNSRLPACVLNSGEGEHWIARYHRFDFTGGWERHAANQFQGGTYPQIPVPPDAHHLELWFEATDNGACHSYDSQGGNNYVLPITH